MPDRAWDVFLMNVVIIFTRASLLALFTTLLSLSVTVVDASASSLKQRAPLHQKNLHQNDLNSQAPNLRGSTNNPDSEQSRREEAQLLYNFYRARESMTHEQAIDVLEKADFPTSHIIAK